MKSRGRLKNITLSADENLIAEARKRASHTHGTLNLAFREWLEQFTRPVSSKEEYEALMKSMKLSLDASKFSRDSANER